MTIDLSNLHLLPIIVGACIIVGVAAGFADFYLYVLIAWIKKARED